MVDRYAIQEVRYISGVGPLSGQTFGFDVDGKTFPTEHAWEGKGTLMGDIIQFKGKPPVPDGVGDQETIGSLLRRKRYFEGPPPKRRLGHLAMRKARDAIQRDAHTIENCLRWLVQIAKADHDPRALAAMINHWDNFPEWNPLQSVEDCEVVMALLQDVIVEYGRRFPMPPPRIVK